MIQEVVKKVQEFFPDLKVSEFMNKSVVWINPRRKLLHAKEIMRIKRISGVPVVDENERVIGIVSLEDIIKALEGDYIEDPVEKWMTKDVVTLKPDDDLEKTISLFEKYGYGRFPVVDENGKLVGIVTKHDILTGLLVKLGTIYLHDARRKEVLENPEFFDRSLITGEVIDKKGADFSFHIDYFDINLAGIGASKLKQFLLEKGMDERIARRVAIATYEAETNVVIHSGSDGYIYCFLRDDQIVVRVEDFGRGIENVEIAMKEGFTTAPDHIREMGFGAGMGLPNMKRYSDKMVIVSEAGKGVVVEMIFFKEGGENETQGSNG